MEGTRAAPVDDSYLLGLSSYRVVDKILLLQMQSRQRDEDNTESAKSTVGVLPTVQAQ